jgi:hypothetical protein
MTGPVTVPAISLPKSGGARRGVDEKFAANPGDRGRRVTKFVSDQVCDSGAAGRTAAGETKDQVV